MYVTHFLHHKSRVHQKKNKIQIFLGHHKVIDPKELAKEVHNKVMAGEAINKRNGNSMEIRIFFIQLFLIVLGFNNTSTLVGHFILCRLPEKGRRDRRDSKGDERGTGKKVEQE